MAGGAGCGGCLATNEADLYDPASGTFRPNLGLLAAPRALHTATVLQNGQVLLAGGCLAVDGPTCATANVLASAELYDPTTGTWTPTAPMAVARAFAAATALPGGGVLVAGGCPGEYTGGECRGDVASAEIYQ